MTSSAIFAASWSLYPVMHRPRDMCNRLLFKRSLQLIVLLHNFPHSCHSIVSIWDFKEIVLTGNQFPPEYPSINLYHDFMARCQTYAMFAISLTFVKIWISGKISFPRITVVGLAFLLSWSECTWYEAVFELVMWVPLLQVQENLGVSFAQ